MGLLQDKKNQKIYAPVWFKSGVILGQGDKMFAKIILLCKPKIFDYTSIIRFKLKAS